MENYGDEFDVADYMRLMKDFLGGRMNAQQYVKGYFDLTVKRVNIPNEDVSRITQQAYGDADDYEPDSELRQTDSTWIDEVQLKERVLKSLRRLETLGYS